MTAAEAGSGGAIYSRSSHSLVPQALSTPAPIPPLAYMPTTTIYVSSYSYICVLILSYMCPHTTICVSSYYYMCVLILLYVCPHTNIYLSLYHYMCVLILVYVPHTLHICVLILYLDMCPHTLLHMCPHNTKYVSSY